MSMTDPIADMLTRVRNALTAGKEKVDIPASAVKEGIARILRDEGFIINYRIIEDSKQGIVRITLKYSDSDIPAIENLQRISRPGRRVYVGTDEIPRVLNGMGIAILSTSKGILSDRDSRTQKVGGELLCYVW
jgi:small subunit ribosomal protein S8